MFAKYYLIVFLLIDITTIDILPDRKFGKMKKSIF